MINRELQIAAHELGHLIPPGTAGCETGLIIRAWDDGGWKSLVDWGEVDLEFVGNVADKGGDDLQELFGELAMQQTLGGPLGEHVARLLFIEQCGQDHLVWDIFKLAHSGALWGSDLARVDAQEIRTFTHPDISGLVLDLLPSVAAMLQSIGQAELFKLGTEMRTWRPGWGVRIYLPDLIRGTLLRTLHFEKAHQAV